MPTITEILSLVESNYVNHGYADLKTFPSHCRHLLEHFGRESADSVNYLAIERYKTKRRKAGAAPKTINNELSILRRGFRIAVRAGLLRSIPDFELFRIGSEKARRDFIDPEQMQAVCEWLPVDVRRHGENRGSPGPRREERQAMNDLPQFDEAVWDKFFEFIQPPEETMARTELQEELQGLGIDVSRAVSKVRNALEAANARVKKPARTNHADQRESATDPRPKGGSSRR